jgi:hypothetical protein
MNLTTAKQIKMMTTTNKANFIRIGLGFGALVLGFVEYIFSRPLDSFYLGKIISRHFGNFSFNVKIFGPFGGVLPEFVHPFSFALFTLALFPKAGRKLRGIICLFWLVVDLFFEIGQYYGAQLAEFMTKVLPLGYVSDLVRNYFLNGVYDHVDILAIVCGILTAFLIGEFTIKGGKENESIFHKTDDHQDNLACWRRVLATCV